MRNERTIALDDVRLVAQKGELVTIVGPSGCGKSTLLYIIAGLIAPSGGQFRVDGQRVVGPTARCGIVFQEFRIFPWRTALQNVTFGLELRNQMSVLERRETARRYLHMVGLDRFENHLPKELSGRDETASRDRPDPGLRARGHIDG